MAFEGDTTQDIIRKVFNVSSEALQMVIIGGASLTIGRISLEGDPSGEPIEGSSTYGLEVDVTRLPANVSPNISSMQNNISSMQDNISTMQPDVSLARVYLSIVQPDISIIQVDASQIQQNLSTAQQDISVMQNHTSLIRVYTSTIASAMVSETKSRVRIADTWTSGVHGVRSAISTAAVRIVHGSSTALKRGMLCRAHRNNVTIIYVGFAGVTGEATASTCGHPLAANQSFLIEANNSFSPYAIANAAAQKLHYFGI